MTTKLLSTLPLALAAAALFASAAAHATLEGQSVTISESFSQAALPGPGYTYSGPQPAAVQATVTAADYERTGTFSGSWLGTTVDVNPANQTIAVFIAAYPYGVQVWMSDWTFALAFDPQRGERFTNVWTLQSNSAHARANASFTDNSITLDLSGGYTNFVSPYGPAGFYAYFGYGAEAAPVPEPGTWALGLAGLAALGLKLHRRKTA